jgi:hypothetical protein
MIFVDTSFLVALALPHDSLYDRAAGWAGSRRDELLTTDFVICEFINALSHPKVRPKAHRTLHWLRHRDGVVIIDASRTWIESALKLHAARPDKEWSLTDCISFEVMQTAGVTQALTHDHHFEQAGFVALLRNDPPQ